MNNPNNLFLANKNTNSFFVCGDNTYSQSGLGDSAGTHITGLQTIPELDSCSIICISSGQYHSAIVTSESLNNLYVCGSDSSGQLGIASITSSTVFRQPDFFSSKKVIQVMCGTGFTVCITNEPYDNIYGTGSIRLYQSGFRVDSDLNPNIASELINIDVTDIYNFTQITASLFRDISGTPLSNIQIIGGTCGNEHTIVYSNDRFYATGNNNYSVLTHAGSNSVNGFIEMEFDGSFSWENRRPIGVSTCSNSTICTIYNSYTGQNEIYFCGKNSNGKFGIDADVSSQIDVLTYFNPVTTNIGTDTRIMSAYVSDSRMVIMTDESTNNLWFGGVAMMHDGDVSSQINFGNTITRINTDVIDANHPGNNLFIGDLRDKQVMSVQMYDKYIIALTNEESNNVYFCGDNNNLDLFNAPYGSLASGDQFANLAFANVFAQIIDFVTNINISVMNIIDSLNIYTTTILDNANSLVNTMGVSSHSFVVNNLLASVVYNNHYDALTSKATPFTCIFEQTTLESSLFNTSVVTPSTGTQYIVNLTPYDSVFDNYVGLTITLDRNIYTKFAIYLLEPSSVDTTQILDVRYMTEPSNIYYEFLDDAETMITIYTKIFGSLMITRTEADDKATTNIFMANKNTSLLYVCGSNTNGKMGIDLNSNDNIGLFSVMGVDDTQINGISYGVTHNAILTSASTGNLRMCGNNGWGQQGAGEERDDVSVFQNPYFFRDKKVIHVMCGDEFTLCITNEPSDNIYGAGVIHDYRSGFRVDDNLIPTSDYNVINNEIENVRNFTQLNASLFSDISGNRLSNIQIIGGACGPHHTIVYSNERFYGTGRDTYGQLTYVNYSQLNGFTEMQFAESFSWSNRRPTGVSTCENSTVCMVYNSETSQTEIYYCGGNNYGKFGTSYDSNQYFSVLTYFDPANTNIDASAHIMSAYVSKDRMIIITDEDRNNLWFGGLAISNDNIDNNVQINFNDTITRINTDASYVGVPEYNLFVGDLRDKHAVSVHMVDSYIVVLTDETFNNVYFCGSNGMTLFKPDYDYPENQFAKLSFINVLEQSSDYFIAIDVSHINIINTSHIHNLTINYDASSIPDTLGISSLTFNSNNMLYNAVNSSHIDAVSTTGQLICTFDIMSLNDSFFGTYNLTPSTGTQFVIKLSPERTVFDDYVSFTFTIDRNIYKDFIMYLHSPETDETIQIPNIEDMISNPDDVYFEFSNSEKTRITLYTKHFSTLMITSTDLNCLTRGTTILTPYGYVAIEKLKDGDYVLTSDNRKSKIKKVHRIFVHSSKETNPYIIPKNAFGKNYPPIETVISGLHKIKFNNVWIVPRKFNFRQKISSNIIEYFHIELENYLTDHLVINGGLVVESYRSSNKTNNIECRKRVKSGVKLIKNVNI